MKKAGYDVHMPAETIDDVLRALDGIIKWSFDRRSRLGYFAALYRRVTMAVKQGIADNIFQDGARMERLDVIFASRYLDALQEFRSGRPTTQSWHAAFQAGSYWYPLVLQQLLVGMNAHINLDLGVAAACCAPGDQFPGLQADFNQINTLLAEQVGAVETELAEISPWIGLLEKFDLRTETKIINFSMTRARDCAWMEAGNLAATSRESLDAAIAALDLRVAVLGRLIVSPPLLVKLQLLPVRARENNNVRRVLEILAGREAAAATSASA